MKIEWKKDFDTMINRDGLPVIISFWVPWVPDPFPASTVKCNVCTVSIRLETL
jgi:hypothetical protein